MAPCFLRDPKHRVFFFLTRVPAQAPVLLRPPERPSRGSLLTLGVATVARRQGAKNPTEREMATAAPAAATAATATAAASGGGNAARPCQTQQQQQQQHDPDADACWICLDGPREGSPLVAPCQCPRLVHQACLAKWQLTSAGKK